MAWSYVAVLTPVDGYQWVMPVRESDHKVLRELDGTSRAAGWVPIPMKLVRETEKEQLKGADMPWYRGHCLILREEAVRRLRPILLAAGELLPLTSNEGPLSLWNVTNIVDALDVQRSDIVWFRDLRRILHIRQHVFKSDVIASKPAFRLPGRLTIYVGGEFVDTVQESGLTGLAFRRVSAE